MKASDLMKFCIQRQNLGCLEVPTLFSNSFEKYIKDALIKMNSTSLFNSIEQLKEWSLLLKKLDKSFTTTD
jgi:hypothetical protein